MRKLLSIEAAYPNDFDDWLVLAKNCKYAFACVPPQMLQSMSDCEPPVRRDVKTWNAETQKLVRSLPRTQQAFSQLEVCWISDFEVL